MLIVDKVNIHISSDRIRCLGYMEVSKLNLIKLIMKYPQKSKIKYASVLTTCKKGIQRRSRD